MSNVDHVIDAILEADSEEAIKAVRAEVKALPQSERRSLPVMSAMEQLVMVEEALRQAE